MSPSRTSSAMAENLFFPNAVENHLALSTSAEQHEVISPECAALMVPLTPTAAPRSLKFKSKRNQLATSRALLPEH